MVGAIHTNTPSLIGSCLVPSIAAMRRKLDASYGKVAVQCFVDMGNNEAQQIKARARARMRAAAFGAELSFDMDSQEAIDWARDESGALIVEISESSRVAIQAVMARAFEEHIPPPQVARLIEPLIGLDEARAMAVMNLRDKILEGAGNLFYAGNTPIRVPEEGFSSGALQARLDTYADQLLRERALTIARTETVDASTEAQNSMWEKAIAEGYLDPKLDMKEWLAGPDACDKICGPMDGQKVPIDEQFETPDGDLIDGPGAHPNCECGQGLADVSSERDLRAASNDCHDEKGEFCETGGGSKDKSLESRAKQRYVESIKEQTKAGFFEKGEHPKTWEQLDKKGKETFFTLEKIFGKDAAAQEKTNEPVKLKGISNKEASKIATPWIEGSTSPKTYDNMRDPSTKEGREFTRVLNALPKYEGNTYRGLMLSHNEFSKLSSEKEFTVELHSSSSKEAVVAQGYTSGRGGVAVVMKFTGGGGRDLSRLDLGGHEGEVEVVHTVGSRYKMTRGPHSVKNIGGGGHWKIWEITYRRVK